MSGSAPGRSGRSATSTSSSPTHCARGSPAGTWSLPLATHPRLSSGIGFDAQSLETRRAVFRRAVGRLSFPFLVAFALETDRSESARTSSLLWNRARFSASTLTAPPALPSGARAAR